MSDPLADREESWPVTSSRTVYRGKVVGLRVDTVANPDASTFDREVVEHVGAVGIVAVDDADRVLVVTQYRHPMGRRMVELPAGLRDEPGEDPVGTARRELEEEGRVRASRWTRLFDLALSPGVSTEVLTLYLAEGIEAVGVPDGFAPHDEESSMTRTWVPLGEFVDAVLAGRVANAALVAGVLALRALRERRGQ